MKKIKLLACIAIIGIFFLSNCKKEETELKAVITVASTAGPGDTIVLDGSKSTGENLNYLWTVKYSGGIVTTSDAYAVKTYFVAETNGNYFVTLRITSGNSFSEVSTNVIVEGSKTLSGTLTENMTLSDVGDSVDYIITEDIIVPSGITLKVEKYTTLKFADDVGLIIEGTLNAVQAEFKAYETNWKGIHFKSTGNRMINCTIDRGGSSSYTSSADEKANITMTNNSSLDAYSTNIYISNSAGYGIVIEDGCTFSGSYGSYYIISTTNANGPGIFPAIGVLGPTPIKFLLNETSGTYINVRGTTSIQSATFSIIGFPYMVLGDITSSAMSSEGAIVYFADGVGLTIRGDININGGKLSSLNQVAGSWKGIFCNLNTANINVKDATIEYAGSSPFTYNSVDYSGALIGGSSLNINNSNISNNIGFGCLSISDLNIWSMRISNSTINNNSEGAVIAPFDWVDDIVSTANNNTFSGYTNVPVIWVIEAVQNNLGTWVNIDGTMSNVDYKMTTNATISGELILDAGVGVQFESDAYWIVNGGVLTSNGTPSLHVRLNGEGPSTATGLWKGISLTGGSTTGLSLDYTEVIGGGSVSGSGGNINLDITGGAGNISIINSQINYSGRYGIYATSGTDDYNLKDLSNNNVYIGNATADWNF